MPENNKQYADSFNNIKAIYSPFFHFFTPFKETKPAETPAYTVIYFDER
jgi:hypothetical protein